MSRSIIKKTAGIGGSTLISRFFAYFREILTIQFLGIGAVSDAFFIALRVPSSLRKVFAEGALSSLLVPALIDAERKHGASGVNKLLTLSFVVIEAIVGFLVIIICCLAPWIVALMGPGASQSRLEMSAQFLQILAPFLLFLSSSAVLAAALQASHRFFVPAIAPAVLNVMYIVALSLGLYFSWSVQTFCWSMLVAAFLNFAMHAWVCMVYNFRYERPDEQAWQGCKHVILQLIPCLLSVGIGEVNFWIDSAFASYLKVGTLSLLRYAYQFINIPLGVIGTALSTVLLPYFSKISHSKQELGAYLSEAMKFLTWMMLPMTMVMMFCSKEIFETMFFSGKFTMDHVMQAQSNMNAYLIGLTFFALEKVVLNAFYALRASGIATGVAIATIALNFFMNRWLMGIYGGMGLALATSISAGVRVALFLFILVHYFGIDLQFAQLGKLLRKYLFQLLILGTVFYGIATVASMVIAQVPYSLTISFLSLNLIINSQFFLHSFGYWLWFGPLSGLFFIAIYRTRKMFGVSFSYLD